MGFTVKLTDHSGTIDDAGVSQEIIPAEERELLDVQNVSDTDMWLNFGDDASAGPGSYLLKANGGAYTREGDAVPRESVHIFCAAAGKSFTAKSGT